MWNIERRERFYQRLFMKSEVKLKNPPWLKKKLPSGETFQKVHNLLRECRLHTVCQEAHCPNLGECFSQGTATFLIMGDRCTRNCSFCAIRDDSPLPLDEEEPEEISRAVEELGLKYAVITSVSRDDLPDGGADHFSKTIRAIRVRSPGTSIEVLIPDFQGSETALGRVVMSGPDVINHNIETVPRLYAEVRPQAVYERSLQLLTRVGKLDSRILTKSGLMLGLGESHEEIIGVSEDLLKAGCQILTLGQYLSPSSDHHPVIRYVAPKEFSRLERIAYEMGFNAVASGPFVRSSYHAGEMSLKAGVK
jgi:lipoic acid synthetase